jgi:hypothetical protein
MNKFLSVLMAGLITSSISVGAFAADAAKPLVAPTSAVAEKATASKVVTKKDSSFKATVKKLLAPSSKKTDVKLK